MWSRRCAASTTSASTSHSKLRTVVDTDVFVSGLIVRSGSLPGRLVDAVIADTFALVTSEALDAEIIDVLGRAKLTERYDIDPALRRALLDRITVAEHVTPPDSLPIAVRDPKDAKFIACALSGNAAYLVSGDSDLLVLDGHPALGTLRIVTVRAFLELLG